jgi:hypothetical protein
LIAILFILKNDANEWMAHNASGDSASFFIIAFLSRPSTNKNHTMKKIFGKLSIILCLSLASALMPANKINAQPGASVSLQVFYDDLSPYGQWISDPSYGYVWVPSVGNDFRPYYSSGHWVMTEYGNMWVSDYPWGWAPFHYGRWTHDGYYGWVWIPDTDWGPAWVSWRSSNDYYGWAPMGPGISVQMSFGSYNPPDDWWVFIAPTYIYYPQWRNYYHGYGRNTTIIRNTTFINNTYTNNRRIYVGGPRTEDVKRRTRQDVTVYKVRNDTKPGNSRTQNNTVNVYRPAIEKSGRTAVPNSAQKAERAIGKPQPVNDGGRVQRNQQQNTSSPVKATSQSKPNGSNGRTATEAGKNVSPAQANPAKEKSVIPQQSKPQDRKSPTQQQNQQPQQQQAQQQAQQRQQSQQAQQQSQQKQQQAQQQTQQRQQQQKAQQQQSQQKQQQSQQQQQRPQQQQQPKTQGRSQPVQEKQPEATQEPRKQSR